MRWVARARAFSKSGEERLASGTERSISTILALESRSCSYQRRKRSARVFMVTSARTLRGRRRRGVLGHRRRSPTNLFSAAVCPRPLQRGADVLDQKPPPPPLPPPPPGPRRPPPPCPPRPSPPRPRAASNLAYWSSFISFLAVS